MHEILKKRPLQRSSKFSFRVKHPRAIGICKELTLGKRLSSYIERLILMDSLSLPDSKEQLLKYKKRCLEQIRIEKGIYQEKKNKWKAEKTSVITDLQEKVEEINKLLEQKK